MTTITKTPKASAASKATTVTRDLKATQPISAQVRVDFVVSATLTLPVLTEDVRDCRDFVRHTANDAATLRMYRRWAHDGVFIGAIDSYTMSQGIYPEFGNPDFPLSRSPKRRLADLRTALHGGSASQNVTLTLDGTLWNRVQSQAAAWGIDPAEHCLLCITYYAARHRRKLEKIAKKA